VTAAKTSPILALMTKEDFWAHVDAARAESGGVTSKAPAALEARLEKLSGDQIRSFDGWLSAYRSLAGREDLWAAVYTIMGGCSDDSFDYFRGWLVAQGEAAYLAAIRDPESLGELRWEGSPRCEMMLGVATRAFESSQGTEMPWDAQTVVVPGSGEWPADRLEPGQKWTAELLQRHYPRLFAKFWERDAG
jgi:hypothetical protein